MAAGVYKVSERGQMALPADARRRWHIADGGSVEVVDLGNALVILPTSGGGLRELLSDAIDAAGGYEALASRVAAEEPGLS